MQSVEVPIIDIADFGSDRSIDGRVCKQVSDAAENIGFMVIAGHGVPDSVIRNCWEAGRSFFDLPLAERMATIGSVSGHPYGYAPLKSESLAATLDIETLPDLKETFSIGPGRVITESDDSAADQFQSAQNIWPNNCPGFRQALEHYYATLNELGFRLMHIFAMALGEPPDYFDHCFSSPISALRLLNYPAIENESVEAQIRAGEHTDYGSLTILLQDDSTGGLQVKIDGMWHDVPAVPGTFVINIGDLLARWSNDKWISTLHRVVSPSNQTQKPKRRQAVAFFHQPNWDAEVSCIPGCLAEGDNPRYEKVLAGPHLANKYRKSTYT